MAIKGKAFTKTAWAFQERPVASSKLNDWDDRIEAAFELVHYLLNQAWGGGEGVLRGATANDLAAAALDPPAMAVEVQPGYAFIGGCPYRLKAAVRSADVTAPVSHPRIDVVQARLDNWDVTVKMGEEAASPFSPEADPDCMALAELYLRPGMVSIRDADDGTNGYIADVRAYL
jgi:hypothetical protein